MRNWPSIVPAASEDYYIVLNSFGRHGVAFVETDPDRANYEITISDLMAGQHRDPPRMIPVQSGDQISHAIAREILRRLDLKGDDIPSELGGFIGRHVGPDRQLTLRLAS